MLSGRSLGHTPAKHVDLLAQDQISASSWARDLRSDPGRQKQPEQIDQRMAILRGSLPALNGQIQFSVHTGTYVGDRAAGDAVWTLRLSSDPPDAG